MLAKGCAAASAFAYARFASKAGSYKSGRCQCLRIFSTMAVVELFSTNPSTFTVPP